MSRAGALERDLPFAFGIEHAAGHAQSADVPGRESIRVPLPATRTSDWTRAHCS